MTRLMAIVHGRVHGVGYRYFAVKEATPLGLAGFVRNAANGTVEVVAEGPRPTLEHFLDLLRRGPLAGHVSEVETTWGPATGGFPGFHVRY